VTSDHDGRSRSEARGEAAPVALVAAASLLGLAALSRVSGWQLLGLRHDWWIWLVVAAPVALLALALLEAPRAERPAEANRRIAIVLIVLALAGSLTALALLLATLVQRGDLLHAPQLLVTAFALLLTNVAVFGIALWELDGGGPTARARAGSRVAPDLQFPQDENPGLARPGWAPHAYDYLYVSLTNSIAFSPTDTMPLTLRAKSLMAVESVVSAVTVLVVAARAVNVFGQ
jgi:uncharacterized membrane protein